MTGKTLRTDRLLLRRWRPDDLDPFASLCRDPEVMKFIGPGKIRNRQQTKKSIEAFEQEWQEKGFGPFAVELLESRSFIGFTGLSTPTFLPEIMPAVEIGWRLARDHWGQGYATEAAQASLKFGLEYLRLPAIVSIIQRDNKASRKVIKKIGMCFDRETRDPSCGRAVEVYRKAASSPSPQSQTIKI